MKLANRLNLSKIEVKPMMSKDQKELESHNYLYKRLKIYNMFRGNEVSRANSVASPSHFSPHKSEISSDQD